MILFHQLQIIGNNVVYVPVTSYVKFMEQYWIHLLITQEPNGCGNCINLIRLQNLVTQSFFPYPVTLVKKKISKSRYNILKIVS